VVGGLAPVCWAVPLSPPQELEFSCSETGQLLRAVIIKPGVIAQQCPQKDEDNQDA